MDLPSSLGCNECDWKQRGELPASQILNTQMAPIARAVSQSLVKLLWRQQSCDDLEHSRKLPRPSPPSERNKLRQSGRRAHRQSPWNDCNFSLSTSYGLAVRYLLRPPQKNYQKVLLTNTEINYRFATLQHDLHSVLPTTLHHHPPRPPLPSDVRSCRSASTNHV